MYLHPGNEKFPSAEDTDFRRVSRVSNAIEYALRNKISTIKTCSKPSNSSESFAIGPYRFNLYEPKSTRVEEEANSRKST